MKKHRINTIISLKHHAILKKHLEEFGTQRSVLEHALDSLENKLNNQNSEVFLEEELWMRVGREIKGAMVIVQKDLTKMLFRTADFEQINHYMKNEKPSEFALEWYYNKPLKECSLQEIIDGIILQIKLEGGADTINYNEDFNCYNITMTHSLGINCSKIVQAASESVFKSYGVNFDSNISERSVFFKVFKNGTK